MALPPHVSAQRPAIRFASGREIALLIATGIALRIAWMLLAHALTQPLDLGEASNEALAFARQGIIADAYFPGQGPTAHLMPTMIVIAGTIERLLGVDSAAANLALAGWALVQVSVGFVLTAVLFRRLGAGRTTELAGLATLCLLPAQIAQEAADFRFWDNALAYDLAAANLLWIATLSDRRALATRDLAIAAIGSALAFFVNPPAGLAVCAAYALFLVMRSDVAGLLRWALLTGIALAVAITPWAMRNRAMLGEPVLLRSNLGVDLAIANYAGALDPVSPRAALTARMEAVHQTEPRLRAAGGEVAYARQTGARTWAWIAAHPIDFARLSLRHYRQYYIPDTWEERSTNWDGANRFRIVCLQLVGALGVAGLIAGLIRGARGYRPIAAYLVTVGLPYALVQPMPRYGYLAYPLLVLLAVRLVVDLVAVTARVRRTAVAPLAA